MKVLRRSITDKKLFGICGGAGEYFDIDPTIIRIIYVIFTMLSGGAGILIYLLMYLVIPEGQPQQEHNSEEMMEHLHKSDPVVYLYSVFSWSF